MDDNVGSYEDLFLYTLLVVTLFSVNSFDYLQRLQTGTTPTK